LTFTRGLFETGEGTFLPGIAVTHNIRNDHRLFPHLITAPGYKNIPIDKVGSNK